MAEENRTNRSADDRATETAVRRQATGKHKSKSSPAARPPASVRRRLTRLERALARDAETTETLLSRIGELRETIRGAPPGVTKLIDAETAAGIENGMRLRRENVAPVDQPLALICQAPRSGGTLLARLFDGHPQCHAHPHELHIGDRRPHVWPEIELDEAPEAWFAKLREERLSALFSKGKRRIALKAQNVADGESYYPCILPPAFQRTLFLDEVERRSPIGSEREVLNCYMTSLFNGWLDNQNLRGAERRWVVAFSPRRAWGDGLDKLFELYPDGRLISILRDPLSWYSSAQGRDPDADPETLLERWDRSVREMIDADSRFGDRVCVIRFDELVLETEATMRTLADFLGIDFDPTLTLPTFNGYPVGANSSFDVRDTGVVTDPVDRHKELLSSSQRDLVKSSCEQLYREALPLAARRPSHS
jgi:hypothetical protein